MSTYNLNYKILRLYWNRFAVVPLVTLSFLFNCISSDDVAAVSGKTTVKKGKRTKRAAKRVRGARTKRAAKRVRGARTKRAAKRVRGVRSKRASLASRGARSKRAAARPKRGARIAKAGSKRNRSRRTSPVLAPIARPRVVASAPALVSGTIPATTAVVGIEPIFSSATTLVATLPQSQLSTSAQRRAVPAGRPLPPIPATRSRVVQAEVPVVPVIPSLRPLAIAVENVQPLVPTQPPSSGTSINQTSFEPMGLQAEAQLVLIPSPPPAPPLLVIMPKTKEIEGQHSDAFTGEPTTTPILNANIVEEGNNLVEAMTSRRLAIEDDSDEEGFDSEDEFSTEEEKKSSNSSNSEEDSPESSNIPVLETISIPPLPVSSSPAEVTSALGAASKPMENVALIATPPPPPPPPLASPVAVPKHDEDEEKVNSSVATEKVDHTLEIVSSKIRSQELAALVDAQNTIMKSSKNTSKKYKLAEERKGSFIKEKEDLETKIKGLEKADKKEKQKVAKGVLSKLKKMPGGNWLADLTQGARTLNKITTNQENNEEQTASEEKKAGGWMHKISKIVLKKKEEKLKKKEESKKKIDSLKRKKNVDEEPNESQKKRRSINSGEWSSTDEWGTGEWSSGEWKVDPKERI